MEQGRGCPAAGTHSHSPTQATNPRPLTHKHAMGTRRIILAQCQLNTTTLLTNPLTQRHAVGTWRMLCLTSNSTLQHYHQD